MFIYIGFSDWIEFFNILFIAMLRVSLLSLIKEACSIYSIPYFLTLLYFIFHILISLWRYTLPHHWSGLWVDFGILIITYVKFISIYIFIYLTLIPIPSRFCCIIQLCRQFDLIRIIMERTLSTHLLITYDCTISYIFAIFRLLHILVLYFMILVCLLINTSWSSHFLFLIDIRCSSTFQAVSLLFLNFQFLRLVNVTL